MNPNNPSQISLHGFKTISPTKSTDTATNYLNTIATKDNNDKQKQPYNIDKVPVPSCTFKPKVTLSREMTFLQAQRNEEQHQHADEHVKTVEARQHEEG